MEDKLKELTFQQALIIGLCGAAFYYYFIFASKNSETLISQSKLEIAQFEGEIKKYDKEIKRAEEVKSEIEVLEKDMSVKFSYVSGDLTKSEVLQDLSVEARQAGLSIESISESGIWVREISLEYIEVPIQVSGDFSQVMGFLSNLSREKKLIIINKFQLNASAINTEREDYTNKPREVNFNVSIRVYRKIPGKTEYTPSVVKFNKNKKRGVSKNV